MASKVKRSNHNLDWYDQKGFRIQNQRYMGIDYLLFLNAASKGMKLSFSSGQGFLFLQCFQSNQQYLEELILSNWSFLSFNICYLLYSWLCIYWKMLVINLAGYCPRRRFSIEIKSTCWIYPPLLYGASYAQITEMGNNR